MTGTEVTAALGSVSRDSRRLCTVPTVPGSAVRPLGRLGDAAQEPCDPPSGSAPAAQRRRLWNTWR